MSRRLKVAAAQLGPINRADSRAIRVSPRGIVSDAPIAASRSRPSRGAGRGSASARSMMNVRLTSEVSSRTK